MDLRPEEWIRAIEFLTATGQTCDTKRQEFILLSDTLGQSVRLRISANALRSVEHRGGLDAYLAKAGDDELSPRARLIKKQIAKKAAEVAAA